MEPPWRQPRKIFKADVAPPDAGQQFANSLFNALIGGFDRSLSLEPLSIHAQTGLALAAGVESMTIRSIR